VVVVVFALLIKSTKDRSFKMILIPGEVLQDFIAEFASTIHTLSAEAQAHATLGVVRQVDRVVAPPGAMVVPEVVIRVVCEHADRWFFKCVHGVSPFGFFTRNFGPQKNRRSKSGSAVNEVRGEFFVWAFHPHIAWRFHLRKPPWDFSFPGWHPDPPNAATGIPDALIFILQIDGDSKLQMCHKIQPVWICFSGGWQQGLLSSETPHRRKKKALPEAA
jgi:hypothetical protein